MRLELTGRHLDITPALRRLVEAKLWKLERLLSDRALSAHCVLTRAKHRHRTEITLHARGERFLHAVADGAAWEPSVGAVIDKITQQAQKVKGKQQQRKGGRRLSDPVLAGVQDEAAPARAAAPRPAKRRPKAPAVMRAAR